jgi:predicted TIM-barrel fold metal-dependent hydrolase
MKKIDFENHFATTAWVDALYGNKSYPRLADDKETGQTFLWYDSEVAQPFGRMLPKLLDLGQGRIDDMDAAGVDVAVLSLTAPCVEQFEPAVGAKVAADANDAVAEAVRRYPDRFVGFTALAPKDTPTAVAELERTVKELSFKGWITHSNFGDGYLDDKTYWPILAKAEELGVPIYVHPTVPMISAMKTYGMNMAGASFGFGSETALVMMRLIVAGVFDAFPRLRIILGHLGEGLPFMMNRVDRPYLQGHVTSHPRAAALKQTPSYYLRNNMTVSTSGNYLPAAFKCTVEALGIEQVVLGTDHPYESISQCIEFLDGQRMSVAERESVYEGNASRLGITTG